MRFLLSRLQSCEWKRIQFGWIMRAGSIIHHFVALFVLASFFMHFSVVDAQSTMCCSTTSYGSFDTWSMCKNAADTELGTPDSCDTCVSYHCLDWFVYCHTLK